MNTLSARDMRRIIAHLDSVKELTDLLRRAHYDVPSEVVYRAAGAEANIRESLLAAALTDIAVEPAMVEAAE